jgi:hypothetical protein
MKFFISTIVLSIFLVNCAVAKGFDVFTVPGTSKYLRDEVPEKSVPVVLDAAGNEHEAFQIIIRGRSAVKSVSVTASDLKSGNAVISKSNIELRLAHYIELNQSVGGGFRKGFYPDALLPMPSEFAVEQGNSQMVWVNVYVPGNAKPGVYSGVVTLKLGGSVERVKVQLKVRGFSLSVENHFGSAFALWGSQCADYYGIAVGSPEYKAMEERYYWFMTGYRLPPDDIPVPVDSPEAAKYLNDPRVTSYRIPYDSNDPNGFKKRIAYLRDKGWLSKGYVYTIDEPPASEFPNCAAYGRTIDSLAPDAKWLLTAAPHESMFGTVDIWCPILSTYNTHAAADRQAKGDHVWWYTCCGPQHPYPTYLINDSAVSPRILSWFQSLYNVEGVLYWATSIWAKYDGTKYIKRDLWNDPLAFPGANGDGYLLYPGKTSSDDPVPTLRLEMIRQGSEDFETFYILQTAYAKLADALGVSKSEFNQHSRVADYVGRMGMSMMRWKSNTGLLEKTRRQILDDISSVLTGPKVIVSTSVPEEMLTDQKNISITLWTEKGTKVSAKVVGKNGGTNIPVLLTETNNNLSGKLGIKITGDTTRLVIQARKGKTLKTLTRTFRMYSQKPLAFSKAETVCGWSSNADIDRWDLNNADMELAETKRLGKCAKVTFRANVDFPNIRLNYPKGFSNADWSNKGFAAMSLYNPNAFPVSFIVKAFDQDGQKYDGFAIYLDAGESRIDSWSLTELGTTINTSKIAGYEFWMWNRSDPVSIYIGPIVTTSKKP